MKILLFGKNGQVGWELQRSLCLLGHLVALDSNSTEYCGDFTNLQGIVDTVNEVQPNIIINAAAYTAVDKAENDLERARLINALAPDVLAKEAMRLGAWLIHYSTDYVFDGSTDEPWKETDIPAPLNVYGRTKFEGEQLIQNSGCQYLIFRTSWIYATRGENFIKSILRLAKERDHLMVIDDQIGSPTGADLLADITAHAMRLIVSSTTPSKFNGLYHVTSAGYTSWHGYAQLIIETAHRLGAELRIASDAVTPIPSVNYPTIALRPYNSRLSVHKLQTIFGLSLPPWQQGVIRTLVEIL
ncbi:MAG: dTDP-4-dehydrorhamnose reductase [Nitrosomonadaceae bacterium]|nr:dTDP-4-dehydrorhamnose reductase [Nitrosomonadaceae bacterium]